MRTLSIICTFAVALVCNVSDSQAQVIVQGPNGFVVQPTQQFQPPQSINRPVTGIYPGATVPGPHYTNPGITYPTPRPFPRPRPRPQPGPGNGTYPGWGQAQFPVYVSPNQFRGYNPNTGGIDTSNQQIDNTYYDQNRNASRQNGTEQFVQRPVYGANGQIVGYEKGYVWRNSVTGVEHGDLKSYTPNDQGGVNEQIRVKSQPVGK